MRSLIPLIAVLAAAAPLRAQSDSAKLVQLNRAYVDSFIHGDAAWYDAHLTPEFECLCPDGSVVPRATFLAAAMQPMTNKSFSLDSVRVRIVPPDRKSRGRHTDTFRLASSGRTYEDVDADQSE